MCVRAAPQAKGCCWIPSGTQGLPWCFFSNGVVNGYGVSSSKQTATGVEGTLKIGMRSVSMHPLSRTFLSIRVVRPEIACVSIFDRAFMFLLLVVTSEWRHVLRH